MKRKEVNIPFHGEVWKTGDSCVVTIPGHFIKHQVIKEGDTVEFTLKAVIDN